MKNYKAIIIAVLATVFNSMTARAALSTPTQVAIDGDTYVLNLMEKVATLKSVNADKFGENKSIIYRHRFHTGTSLTRLILSGRKYSDVNHYVKLRYQAIYLSLK